MNLHINFLQVNDLFIFIIILKQKTEIYEFLFGKHGELIIITYMFYFKQLKPVSTKICIFLAIKST